MSSTRVSLQDCNITLSFPTPILPTTERTECYVGETLYLRLTISTPVPHSSESLYNSLQSFAHLQVHLGPDISTARQCALPVLKESPWTSTTRPESESQSPILCKGVWALVRTPPSIVKGGIHVAGRQQLFVSLRETPVSHGLKNSPVWATIDKASRLFGKSAAMFASRQIMVNMPLEVSCHQVRASQCADKAFVCVTARNATSDASLSIVPPYINLNSSKVIVDPAFDDRGVKANDVKTPWAIDSGAIGQVVGQGIVLDDRYEFVPVFAPVESTDDEESSSEFVTENAPNLQRQNSGSGSTEDYGLFIPSFNHWLKQAVRLEPREVFNFVYKVVQKGDSQHNIVESEAHVRRQVGDTSTPQKINHVRKLKPGTCLETSVAVAWNCMPKDTHDFTQIAPHRQELQREMSSGGVLATGKRGNVAVRLTSVHWQPPTMLEGVVVTFSGPSLATLGAKILISISILNQTETGLVAAAVLVQQGASSSFDLLALRTVVSIGRIAAGAEATLQLPCLALRTGTVSLGPVQVIDRAAPPDVQYIWTSQAACQIFVVNPAGTVPGDPVLTSLSEETTDGEPEIPVA